MVLLELMTFFRDFGVWHKAELPSEQYAFNLGFLTVIRLNDLQGLNTKKGFDVKVATEVSKLTGLEFVTAPNKVSIKTGAMSYGWFIFF